MRWLLLIVALVISPACRNAEAGAFYGQTPWGGAVPDAPAAWTLVKSLDFTALSEQDITSGGDGSATLSDGTIVYVTDTADGGADILAGSGGLDFTWTANSGVWVFVPLVENGWISYSEEPKVRAIVGVDTANTTLGTTAGLNVGTLTGKTGQAFPSDSIRISGGYWRRDGATYDIDMFTTYSGTTTAFAQVGNIVSPPPYTINTYTGYSFDCVMGTAASFPTSPDDVTVTLSASGGMPLVGGTTAEQLGPWSATNELYLVISAFNAYTDARFTRLDIYEFQ